MGRLPQILPEGKVFEVQKIWNITHEIMRLHILGFKNVEIASQLNITAQTVSNAVNSTIVKRQMEVMQAKRDVDTIAVAERVVQMSGKALDVLETIMDDEKEPGSVRSKVALSILDRNSETAPVRRTESHGIYEHFLRGKTIAEVKQLARDRGYLSKPEQVEDVSFKEIESEAV